MVARTRRRSLLFRLLAGLGVLILAFVAVLLINVLLHPSRQLQGVTGTVVNVPVDAAAERLSALLRFATVSHQDPRRVDPAPFEALRAYLPVAYPAAHGAMTRQLIDGSLLYKWEGSDPTLAPVLLMAHLDVVPGDESATWARPPFSGERADGFIWGRGALDMKGALGAMMEAAELLAQSGHKPRRTVYFALGHDEETGGEHGNAVIAARLKAQGVKLHAVLDEGSVVAVDILPNVSGAVALVGVAEKGYLTVELRVEGEGGHSSMPAPETSVEILAQALTHLSALRGEGMLTPSVRAQLQWLAPELPWVRRLALSNLWLFEGLVKKQMSEKPSSDAMLRTTIAPTMLSGSDKENVLPHRVSALINFRLLQGTSVEQVMSNLRKRITDARVQIEVKGLVTSEPSAVSPSEGPAFDDLHRSIREAFPDAIVVPSLVLGATDSRHYRELTDNIYRFIPVRLRATDIARIHGKDERIAVDNYREAIAFYTHYLRKQ